ncbi:hypothetical protein PROFUN_02088 [Planoprotostelium fungivorum]|uniref:Uncharacterized protein n=1 Tax=Planoprotostelium fungivorum TaxID=1890364 RepID=A0A2P6NBC1_9EUKA|nr:hypothetical protein PROFUN_02088 [Planoprotostelium fungivorum]
MAPLSEFTKESEDRSLIGEGRNVQGMRGSFGLNRQESDSSCCLYERRTQISTFPSLASPLQLKGGPNLEFIFYTEESLGMNRSSVNHAARLTTDSFITRVLRQDGSCPSKKISGNHFIHEERSGGQNLYRRNTLFQFYNASSTN